MATEEDRQAERDRMGNDPSTREADEDVTDPPEGIAEGEDPDTVAHERQEHEEDPDRQEQREAEERGSGQGAV